jgi:uncharacterized phage protein gp47/JayE
MTTDPSEFNPVVAPSAHDNPPGMSAIAYRYGTHATVLQRLLSRLRQQTVPGSETGVPNRPLQTLSIRDRTDPAVALLDTWAVVADVLSFYQERIANEGYWRTAIQDRSILELSRTIGYALRPGVAASTPLVFMVEDAPGSEAQVLIPQGSQVQSIPSQPGELPQTFETVEDFQAQVEWNILTPYLETEFIPQSLESTTTLKLQGSNTLLQVGDTILIVNVNRKYVCTLTKVEPNLQAGYTQIEWSESLPTPPTNPQVFAFWQQASLYGYNAPQSSYVEIEGEGKISSESKNLTTVDGVNTFFTKQLKTGDILIVKNQVANDRVSSVETITSDTSLTVQPAFATAFKNQSFSFIRRNNLQSSPSFQGTPIDLDTVYPKVLPQSWIALIQKFPSNQIKIYRIENVSVIFRSDLGVASKITHIQPEPDSDPGSDFDLRQTSVFLQSEKLELFRESRLKPPIQIINQKTAITLNRVTSKLRSGQSIIISYSDRNNVIKTEVVTVDSMSDSSDTASNAPHTILTIKEIFNLDNYQPETLKIYGNVVLATHGKTVADEVLGSGDGTKKNQQFTLNKPPLTYVSIATSTGTESTLKVYVNRVLWQQVQSLHNQDARSQCYMVQTDEQGKTRIIFGDGVRGTRLPTGQENVRATYRSGIGHAGEVKAGSLILLQNRPLGIREVTNPLPASGAADRDSGDTIRQNAPRTVLTLNQVVSLRDFENFARSFAGIGKAQATPLWTGDRREVYITVADVDGQAAPPALCDTLRDAIAAAGNPLQPVRVESYIPNEGWFNLQARVLIADRYQFEFVEPQIRDALKSAFSFKQREFGQGVASAEVIQTIQEVEGVVAVDLDALYLAGEEQQPELASFLIAKLARWEEEAKPAQILLLNPNENSIVLREWV